MLLPYRTTLNKTPLLKYKHIVQILKTVQNRGHCINPILSRYAILTGKVCSTPVPTAVVTKCTVGQDKCPPSIGRSYPLFYKIWRAQNKMMFKVFFVKFCFRRRISWCSSVGVPRKRRKNTAVSRCWLTRSDPFFAIIFVGTHIIIVEALRNASKPFVADRREDCREYYHGNKRISDRSSSESDRTNSITIHNENSRTDETTNGNVKKYHDTDAIIGAVIKNSDNNETNYMSNIFRDPLSTTPCFETLISD